MIKLSTILLALFAITFGVQAQKKAKIKTKAPIVKKAKSDEVAYGKKFDATTVVTAADLIASVGDQKELKDVVATGDVTGVCQSAGCWMKVKTTEGKELFVKFKDGVIALPQDTKGKATFHGTLTKKVVSIEEQKHMLEDAGKSKEEIEKITEAKEEYRFNSDGVIIKKG